MTLNISVNLLQTNIYNVWFVYITLGIQRWFSNYFMIRTPKPTQIRPWTLFWKDFVPGPTHPKIILLLEFYHRKCMESITKIVTHNVTVLLLGWIIVKISYSPFLLGIPWTPLWERLLQRISCSFFSWRTIFTYTSSSSYCQQHDVCSVLVSKSLLHN